MIYLSSCRIDIYSLVPDLTCYYLFYNTSGNVTVPARLKSQENAVTSGQSEHLFVLQSAEDPSSAPRSIAMEHEILLCSLVKYNYRTEI